MRIFTEKQLEDEEALEKNLNQDKKKTFADEDAYDSEEERKKKLEEEKKQQPEEAAEQPLEEQPQQRQVKGVSEI